MALVEAAKAPDFPAEIALVLSNKANAAGLEFARAQGIATAVIEHKTYGKDRVAFDAAMQVVLEAHGVEIVCLAVQAAVPVLDDDTEETLGARVLKEEHRIYPETLGLLAAGRLRVEGQRVRTV